MCNPSNKKWRQKDQNVKVILNYTSLGHPGIHETLSREAVGVGVERKKERREDSKCQKGVLRIHGSQATWEQSERMLRADVI